jgi:hypothetical protein
MCVKMYDSIIKLRYTYVRVFTAVFQRLITNSRKAWILVILSHFPLQLWKQTYIILDGSGKKMPTLFNGR